MLNIKIRLQNPAFWYSLVIGVLSIVGGYFGLTGADVTNWGVVWTTALAAIANPYVLWITAIYIIGLFVDLSSLGFGDSTVNKAKTNISDSAVDVVNNIINTKQEEAINDLATNPETKTSETKQL